MTDHLDDLDAAADLILQRIAGPLRVGAPLGLGKPHRLLNALYDRIEHDPTRPLQIYTALSLHPPAPGGGLQGRFARPFVQRHFGEDFPRLRYVQAMQRDALPAHIQVEEFYMQSGALLRSTQAQRSYTSLNYTHAADAVAAARAQPDRAEGGARTRRHPAVVLVQQRHHPRHPGGGAAARPARGRCWWPKSIRNCRGSAVARRWNRASSTWW